jgi:hypothetical protein
VHRGVTEDWRDVAVFKKTLGENGLFWSLSHGVCILNVVTINRQCFG